MHLILEYNPKVVK
ncbi:hypothetical protein FOXB_15903 [Fusarium oxysporum f. sp. conglutinans Fo5176]|uniref:Uncharacterized protein n=1 Tax=Fusarium oxysporum (strain Fo5176) TaxID=660025 RepID=F9GB70_FUSOF|nr:hypothetical protein FOXB_15903 [Fusarium oxysporum f. sp. conglutinans Fo5176]